MKASTMWKNGIRKDLAMKWRIAVNEILYQLGKTRQDLADFCLLSRVSITKMLCRDDCQLTGIQFLGAMRAIEEMIKSSAVDPIRKEAAQKHYDMVNDDYLNHGFRE